MAEANGPTAQLCHWAGSTRRVVNNSCDTAWTLRGTYLYHEHEQGAVRPCPRPRPFRLVTGAADPPVTGGSGGGRGDRTSSGRECFLREQYWTT